MERVHKQSGEPESAKRTAQAKFTSWSRENETAQRIDDSPAMVAQRKKISSLFGMAAQSREGPAQREEMDEETPQLKADPVQREEMDEETSQLKADPVQREEMDEETPQLKADPVQREEMDEETPQLKADPVQREEMDEETPQLKQAAQSSTQLKEEVAKPNNTGLPDNLKSGIESLSGMSMDNVKVHYNSSQPAQLNALAYAQGTDIHVAPGQEQHLPHEAWHVVQQAQGRVQPTMQMKEGVPVNDDKSLEHEADVMGAKALQQVSSNACQNQGACTSIQQKAGLGDGGRMQNNIAGKAGPYQSVVSVQRLMNKMGVDKKEYMKKTMSTVYLYAEFDGMQLGVFSTTSGNHAEENLIKYIEAKGLLNGNLVVYLSTSPCSSCFGTRGDGKSGCQERLESLSGRGIVVTVHADHLYQPKDIGQMERQEDLPTGFSSLSSAYSSSFEMDFSRLPKKLHDPEMIDSVTGQSVAQLKQAAQ